MAMLEGARPEILSNKARSKQKFQLGLHSGNISALRCLVGK